VGNREDLIAGAKRCLLDKGYARTTARDIATTAGTSLAAIGYHFGSTQALLNMAVFEALREWGAELEQAMAGAAEPGGGDGDAEHETGSLEQFERYWARVIDSFNTHRELWMATFDVFAQMDRVPEMRGALSDGVERARFAWAELLQGLDPDRDTEQARRVGSLYQALISGVLVQWLIDPDRAPSSRDLAEALRTIAAGVTRAG
jgi:AcrR family transcriptional regulator